MANRWRQHFLTDNVKLRLHLHLHLHRENKYKQQKHTAGQRELQ